MSIRHIFCTNTRGAILLRGLIAMSAGVMLAAVITATTDTNAFRRFAFPIFGVPMMLTMLNLLTRRAERVEDDRRNDA
jgi:glycerol uptake facilitator-like aquaporin